MRIDAADGVLDGTLNMEMAHALAEKEAAAAAVAEGREEALPTTVVADGEALLPPPQKLPSPRALAETRQEASIADHDMEAAAEALLHDEFGDVSGGRWRVRRGLTIPYFMAYDLICTALIIYLFGHDFPANMCAFIWLASCA